MMTLDEERAVKSDLYDHFAQIGKAFGSARRLELIDLLSQSEYTVERLAEEADMSVANTSQHLKTLRAARLVVVRREGVIASYSLANQAVYQAWLMIRRLGERSSADIERLARRLAAQRDQRSSISFAELLTLLSEANVTILDVRPEREYGAGHIRGAISIPLAQLAERMLEIDPDTEVIVYCRGPYSTLSDRAQQLLRDEGYKARRLEQGFPEWRAQDLPLETGEREIPLSVRSE